MPKEKKVIYPDMAGLRNTTREVLRSMVETDGKNNSGYLCYRPVWLENAPLVVTKDSRSSRCQPPFVFKSQIPGPRPVAPKHKKKEPDKENILENSVDDGKPLSSVFSYVKKSESPMSALFRSKKSHSTKTNVNYKVEMAL